MGLSLLVAVCVDRPEMVVGWYHSHPGFGCWLSGVDINTQQSFEALSERAVAVVVDPIQSVKGKVGSDSICLVSRAVSMSCFLSGYGLLLLSSSTLCLSPITLCSLTLSVLLSFGLL